MSRKKRKLKALRAKEQGDRAPLSNRRLTQGLIFSGALNIALATSLIFYAAKSKDSLPKPAYNPPSTTTLSLDLSREVSLQQTLEEYLKMDFESLLGCLSQREMLEGGFTKRDLALSTLASKYDVDVSRALLGQSATVKTLSLDQREESMPIYFGLKDAQYRLIHSFLETEKWPFTSEGLFNRIVQGQSEESLKEAFFLTKEFMLLEALYCPVQLSKDDLLKLVKQGPWDLVGQFVHSKPLVQNFSNPLRIQFLCQYLEFASDQAASLILQIDPEYALEKLSDEKIVTLLGLLEKKTELSQNFILHLALGSRSSWVKQEACRMLYYYSNKEFKNPFDYQEALHFIAREYELSPLPEVTEMQVIPQQVEPLLASNQPEVHLPPSRVYTVQKGDCLSKIAKKHHVNIKDLKAENNLDNDLIHVGMELQIP